MSCYSSSTTKKWSISKLIFPWIWKSFGHDPVIKLQNINKHKTRKPISVSSRLLVPLNGSGPCLPLGMASSKFCNVNEKVIIEQNDIIPRCVVPRKSFHRLLIIPNACPPGSFYSIIGYCQPVWDF